MQPFEKQSFELLLFSRVLRSGTIGITWVLDLHALWPRPDMLSQKFVWTVKGRASMTSQAFLMILCAPKLENCCVVQQARDRPSGAVVCIKNCHKIAVLSPRKIKLMVPGNEDCPDLSPKDKTSRAVRMCLTVIWNRLEKNRLHASLLAFPGCGQSLGLLGL